MRAPALLLLVSLVASCKHSTELGTATTAACPSQDFRTFLTSFANDPGVQEAFTSRPLQVDSMDVAAEPEPRSITRMLDGADLRFPLMPSLQRQEQDGLKMRWKSNGDDKAEVLLSKDDTDYQTFFLFSRRNGCWMLYKINDESL